MPAKIPGRDSEAPITSRQIKQITDAIRDNDNQHFNGYIQKLK